MAELFGRYYVLSIGPVRITGLRVSFKIFKSLQPEPNTTEISIYNLNSDTRTKLQKAPVLVQLDAGYPDNHQTLFKGTLRAATSSKQGTDWVTTVKAGDGELTYRSARINEAFKPGTPIVTIAKRLAARLNIGLGDAEARISEATQRAGLTQYLNGAVMSGRAHEKLTEVLNGLDLEWSMQDERLQILPKGTINGDRIVVLSDTSGLVGSPAVGDKGVTKITSLLQPGIRPGTQVRLEARGFPKLTYRVERVTHAGDTHAQTWYSDAELSIPGKTA